MKRLALTIVFALSWCLTWSSHIVGGEFELIHKSDFKYDLNLILYFDVANGNPGALDQTITATFFSKRTNQRIMDIIVPFSGLTRVDYFQPECSTGEVVTDRLLYTREIELSPEIFNDPVGYYIVWQRCCRNYSITNINSAVPNTGGISAGQTFYLEIPPVVDKNGDPFINSSPRLFPPLNDYGCPNRAYWVDFGGTDDDGDSLVYSLVNPLTTQFVSAFPPNNLNFPSPYPEVVYKQGFGEGNIMNGDPNLKISEDGFLTVTPQSQGLFVFAVKVEEFRDSVKIGEVRRDFQMLVLDKCPVADPPAVLGKKLEDANFTYNNTMVVSFNQGINDEQRCIQVEVSDLDALKASDNFAEEVFIRAIPIGFKDNVSRILPGSVTATLVNGSTAVFDICFEECPLVEEGPFEVGIVAFDDACALPLTDTLKITVFIEPPPNSKPYFQDGSDIVLTVPETAGGFYSKDLIGLDDDLDVLYFQIFPKGFVPEEFGMSFETYQNKPGDIRTRFEWNYDCVQTSFDGKTEFEILVVLDDFDFCLFAHPDTVKMNLKINLPDNTFPEIFSDDLGTRTDRYFHVEKELYESLNFSVFGEDLDNDPIFLDAAGANFELADYGASFPRVDGSGNPGIGGDFSWYLDCEKFNLAELDSFRFYLFVEDIDYCNITSKDTITVDLKVTPPANNIPSVTFTAGNQLLSIIDNTGTITVGNSMVLNVAVADLDPNIVTLELINVAGENLDQDFAFTNKSGVSNVSSNLVWDPDCRSLERGAPSSLYKFTFRITDNHCIEPYSEEVDFFLTVEDLRLEPLEVQPPNVFTPNGDNKNEYFALEWFDEDGRLIYTLPTDNCAGSFLSIKIINRWGRQVFSSNQRNFKWYGNGEPSGVYYYYVEYSNNEYKGTVSMIY